MNSKEILRAIDGFQSGMYSELEFFNLLAIRTHIDAVRDTYDVLPQEYKERFLRWIDDYDTQSDSVCIGENAPEPSVIEALKQMRSF